VYDPPHLFSIPTYYKCIHFFFKKEGKHAYFTFLLNYFLRRYVVELWDGCDDDDDGGVDTDDDGGGGDGGCNDADDFGGGDKDDGSSYGDDNDAGGDNVFIHKLLNYVTDTLPPWSQFNSQYHPYEIATIIILIFQMKSKPQRD